MTRAHQCGLVAEPGDARQLADAVETLYRDRELTRRCGANARRLGLSFDRRAQVARYAEVFRSLMPAAAAPVGTRAERNA
jgi:glycosyltransferase involved in cell wall biosynthesis